MNRCFLFIPNHPKTLRNPIRQALAMLSWESHPRVELTRLRTEVSLYLLCFIAKHLLNVFTANIRSLAFHWSWRID